MSLMSFMFFNTFYYILFCNANLIRFISWAFMQIYFANICHIILLITLLVLYRSKLLHFFLFLPSLLMINCPLKYEA